MKLATLYESYSSMDFDLDVATESKSVLCETYDEAVAWAEAEMREGRDPGITWEWQHNDDDVLQGGHFVGIFATECNEYGTPEESFLCVKDIKKLGE